MRWLHALALAAGIGLFLWLVSQVGLDSLWREASTLGWGVLWIVAVEVVADGVHTAAWQRCFAREHRPPWLRLWGPHLAGGAVNFVTPTATLGGEVVRGSLLPRDVPGTEATASLAVNKLTAAMADVVMALAGVGCVLWVVPLPLAARVGVLAAAVLFALGVGGFLWVQRRGTLTSWLGERRWVVALLGRVRADRVSQAASDVDRRIAAFHAERPAALAASVLLHVAAASLGALQLWLFLHWTDAGAGLRAVAVVFLVARVIDLSAFFIPARLGAQEGARMLAMSLVGLPESLGLLFSLVLRLEQLVTNGLGFVAWAGLAASRSRPVRTAP